MKTYNIDRKTHRHFWITLLTKLLITFHLTNFGELEMIIFGTFIRDVAEPNYDVNFIFIIYQRPHIQKISSFANYFLLHNRAKIIYGNWMTMNRRKENEKETSTTGRVDEVIYHQEDQLKLLKKSLKFPSGSVELSQSLKHQNNPI